MNWKLKLMLLVILGGWSMVASGQNGGKRKSPRFLVIGEQISGSFKNMPEVLRVFIVNDSDDTLRYWGSAKSPSEFFTINPNKYLRLNGADSRNSEVEQKIPPRRSQLILLPLSIEQQPPDTLDLNIGIKLYPWFKSENFKDYENKHKPQILTDKITLRFNKDGSRTYTPLDFEEEAKKTKLNLPTTKLYLLTDKERMLYTVTADETKIIRATDGEYSYTKEKVFLLPVTIHNNSNELLKYYSMTCSWQEFYHIDNKELDVFGTNCDGNIPKEVVVPAHSAHTDKVPFIFDKSEIRTEQHFKIGVNINKNVVDDAFGGYDEELLVYNIVWSNEIQFTPK
ncbi:MAG TPA: hypothetical protein VFE53_14925 [Mucilaginibacter sp.]|jgi:hypothetical protein|nr:hypothetical protein [Mucilaginibacter sp.]